VPARPVVVPGSAVAGAAGAAVTILSCLLLVFVGYVVLLSPLAFERAQDLKYADLRLALARATAPVGQTFIDQPDVQGEAIPGEDTEVEQAQELLTGLGTPVGLMSIDGIGLRDSVILEGTTPAVTRAGLGHQRNSVLPGQLGLSIIFGRAWSHGAPFGDLDRLEPGAVITVTTGQGISTYEVTGRRQPGDVIPRRPPDRGVLILVTASGAPYVPTGVLYVDAVLTSEPQPTPPLRRLTLEPAEATMAGDTSSWLPVMLWSQALLLCVVVVTWARLKWGRRQAWLAGAPLILALSYGLSTAAVQLLPNLL